MRGSAILSGVDRRSWLSSQIVEGSRAQFGMVVTHSGGLGIVLFLECGSPPQGMSHGLARASVALSYRAWGGWRHGRRAWSHVE